MSRSVDERIADVRRIVDAARALAGRETLVPALVASTGLSREGVELALSRHLELDPTDAELHALVQHAGDASHVSVILSANVFVGALRAIALARAASADVVVRPSRRDPVFARALVAEAADPALRLDETLEVEDVAEGQLHVYGRDATIEDVRRRARRGVVVVGHGAGLGVAWITARADRVDAARELAADVVAFDQRGCLSPRLVLVHGTTAEADAFADALHDALERLGHRVPRGVLPAEERAESERYVAAMTYAHRALVGPHHVVGVAPAGAPIIAGPAYRHVHVVASPTERQACAVLAPLARAIVSVGSDDVEAARLLARDVTGMCARVAALGRMQRPRLDGPVDLRGVGERSAG